MVLRRIRYCGRTGADFQYACGGRSSAPFDRPADSSSERRIIRAHVNYADPGASYYEERYRERVIDNLQRRAKAFGFVLQEVTADAFAGAVS